MSKRKSRCVPVLFSFSHTPSFVCSTKKSLSFDDMGIIAFNPFVSARV